VVEQLCAAWHWGKRSGFSSIGQKVTVAQIQPPVRFFGREQSRLYLGIPNGEVRFDGMKKKAGKTRQHHMNAPPNGPGLSESDRIQIRGSRYSCVRLER